MALASRNPIVISVYFLIVLLFAMFVPNPVIQLISLGAAIAYSGILQKGKKSEIFFFLLLFVLITATNPLFSHNGSTPLFYFNGNPVTLESYLYGAGISVMILSVIFWCRALSAVMTGEKSVYIFSRFSGKLAIVLSAALRYIPMLKRQAKAIGNAQKAIGVYASNGYWDRIRSAVNVFYALIGWSLENAVETANSMSARGYGAGKRTNYTPFRFGKADGWFLLLTVLPSLAVITAIFTGQLDFSYYPSIAFAPFSLGAICSVLCFAWIAWMPVILEITECVKWNCYRSRI